jgi:hypothetical protein
MLKLFCHFNRINADDNVLIIFALPFNPYESRETYSHPFPKPYFDMTHGTEVKIGDEYWEIVGQDEDTFNDLLEVANSVGQNYKEKLDKLLEEL